MAKRIECGFPYYSNTKRSRNVRKGDTKKKKKWLDWKRCDLGDFEESEKTLKKKGMDVCQMPARELTGGYVFGAYVAGWFYQNQVGLLILTSR